MASYRRVLAQLSLLVLLARVNREVNMQPITTDEQRHVKARWGVPSIFVMVVATLVVTTEVLTRWATWDVHGKLAAASLLLSLWLGPVLAIWREKSGRKLELDEVLTLAYMALMLATVLFTRGH